ncbi:MAG: hypothetical protein ACK5B9_03875, partial [Flavobacteriia bacterium]
FRKIKKQVLILMKNKRLTVIIIGLPLFAERLQKNLEKFYTEGKFIHLNTYYSKWDKIRSLWLIPKADLVFSINGSITQSKVFDLTLKHNIPFIMNWVGTDVLRAIEAHKNKSFNSDYVQKAIHYCEVSWIQEELKPIGINAVVQNFASFDNQFYIRENRNKKFTVLNYIADEKPEFYGIKEYLELAKLLPNINFLIAGTKGEKFYPLPQNVQALGWVKNMDEVFSKVHVCMRIPEHDGLSTYILESLARGKQVIYKYKFEHCFQASTSEEAAMILDRLYLQFVEGEKLDNNAGKEFVEKNFNSQVILGQLIHNFKSISGK